MKNLFRLFVFFLTVSALAGTVSAGIQNGPMLMVEFSKVSSVTPNQFLSAGVLLKATQGEKLILHKDEKWGNGIYPSGKGKMIISFVEPKYKDRPVSIRRPYVGIVINRFPGATNAGTIKQYDINGKRLLTSPIGTGGLIFLIKGTHSVKIDFGGDNNGKKRLDAIYWHEGDFVAPLPSLLPR